MKKDSTSLYNHMKAIKKKSLVEGKNYKEENNKEKDSLPTQSKIKKKEIIVDDVKEVPLIKKIQLSDKLEEDFPSLDPDLLKNLTTENDGIKISKKTQSLIDKIKQKKTKEGLRKKSENENIKKLRESLYSKIDQKSEQKVSMKKNYNINRNLPYEYKEYINLMEEFDYILNLFVIRNDVCFYEEIEKVLNKTYSKEFSLNDIRRIIYLVPEFYEIKWVFNEKQKNKQLVIDLKISKKNSSFKHLSKKEANERLEIFKYRCLNFLNTGSKNTEDKGKLTEYFDKKNGPEKVEIPMIELPPRNDEIQAKKIIDILNEITEKDKDDSEEIKQTYHLSSPKKESILTKLKKQGLIKINVEKKNLTNKEKVDILKKKILKKMSKKQEKIEKEKKNVKIRPDVKVILINISKILHFHYKIRKVENMFYLSVIDYITKYSKPSLTNQETVFYFNMVLEKVPQWIYLIEDNQYGKIVRMNINMNIEKIIKIINDN